MRTIGDSYSFILYIVAYLVINLPCSLIGEDYALPGGENAGKIKPEFFKRGEVLYAQHCTGCHGIEGDGKGPGAYGLSPKPRDFTTGIYKFRSTKFDQLPTDEDLEKSIRQGIPGTSMPPFKLLPANDIKALAQYLKVFSKDKEWNKPRLPVALATPPDWLYNKDLVLARAAKGKVHYDLVCFSCHGTSGKGDGIASKGLLDSWGNPVAPANLTRLKEVGSGPRDSELFKAITTGLAGSPMVAFGDTLSDEQRWEIVAYIKFMRKLHKDPSLELPEVVQTTESTENQENQDTEDFNEFE